VDLPVEVSEIYTVLILYNVVEFIRCAVLTKETQWIHVFEDSTNALPLKLEH